MGNAGTGSRTGVGALVAVVVAVAVAFLLAVAPWATDDFGYSLDGFNGSVWGLGARAAADDPIGSRLGGVQPDGDRYANHPPLTVWTAAVGSVVSGDRPGAVRGPAILASLAALAALAVLLRDAGLRLEAVAAGVVLTGTSGMFLTYGAMLDTPVVGLPFALAALVVAQRIHQERPPPTPLVVAIGALAALAGWQAALAAGLAAVALALTRRGLALIAGVALGAVVTVGWIGWVHGSLRPLFDQAGVRTGEAGTGTDVGWWTAMGRHMTDLYGPGPVLVLIAVAIVAALVEPRLRPVAVVWGVTVVGYTVLFRNGAAVHDYWTYPGIALVGIGAAAVVQLAIERVPHPKRATTALVAMLVLPLAVVGVVRQTTAETRIREGLDLLPVLSRVPEPDEPTAVPVAVYGATGELPWADHLVHGRALAVDDVAGLRVLPPDLPVLVILRSPPSEALRQRATAVNERFALVPAADLAEHLGG